MGKTRLGYGLDQAHLGTRKCLAICPATYLEASSALQERRWRNGPSAGTRSSSSHDVQSNSAWPGTCIHLHALPSPYLFLIHSHASHGAAGDSPSKQMSSACLKRVVFPPPLHLGGWFGNLPSTPTLILIGTQESSLRAQANRQQYKI